MKKVMILALSVLFLAACKKKEKDGVKADSLVGYWKLDEITFTGNTSFGGNNINFTGEGEDYEGGYYLNADGTMSYDTKYNLVANLTPLPPQSFPVDVSGSGTWKREGNTAIILTDQNGTQTLPIKAETAAILILKQDSTYNLMGQAAKLKLEITLRK